MVSHKLTRTNFEGFIMPEKDDGKRFFTDWSTAATADFVAMMAMAARHFKPYDAAYAQKCLDAAQKSYDFLKSTPEKRFQQGDFRTGGYQTNDSDDRLWAAAEMWETTGNAECLKDFEARAVVAPQTFGRRSGPAPAGKIDENWDWGNVRNLGMFTYVLSKREGRDPNLLEQIRRDTLATADSLVAKAKQDVYGRPLAGRYYWGCNGTVARQVLNLQVANRLSPNPDYVNASLDAVAHLFGRNYYNRSYVTGLGHRAGHASARPPLGRRRHRRPLARLRRRRRPVRHRLARRPGGLPDQRDRHQLAGRPGLRPGGLHERGHDDRGET